MNLIVAVDKNWLSDTRITSVEYLQISVFSKKPHKAANMEERLGEFRVPLKDRLNGL